MTAPYVEETGGYGGPSDDGVAAEGWRLAGRLEGAREAFAEADRAERTSLVLEALLAPLNGSQGEAVR
ncbi:hypothetical protein ACFZC6_16515 [Streptomyces ossamyceticus]|uniref:hypothetical protein n=1 Tax=Streptomyces ossamyceticus TaxID=249581 RepID=UPI0036E6B80D